MKDQEQAWLREIAKTENGDLKVQVLGIEDEYTESTKQIVKFLNERGMGFDYQSLLAYRQWLETEAPNAQGGKGCAARTIALRVAAFKNRIRWIFEHYADSLNMEKRFRLEEALRDIKAPKINSNTIDQDKVLSIEEVERLIRGSTEKLGLIIEFLFKQGVRISELIAIELGDVTDQGNYFEIRLRRTKGSKERKLKIKNADMDRIRDHFQGQRFLFETANGNPYVRQSLGRLIAQAGKKVLGRKISPHTLRHSHVTHQRDRGVNLEDVSRYVGHSSIAITADMYYHGSGVGVDDLPEVGTVIQHATDPVSSPISAGVTTETVSGATVSPEEFARLQAENARLREMLGEHKEHRGAPQEMQTKINEIKGRK